MRWFVEISPMGNKGGQDLTLCVEAPQWQPALQKARALRGDNGALSNFSIELLEDGFRAIDPMARLRYVVKRAPDNAPLTNGSGVESAPSQPPRSAAEPARPAPEPTKPAVPAPAAEVKKPAAAAEKRPDPVAVAPEKSAVVVPGPDAKKRAPTPAAPPTATSPRPAPREPLPSFVVIGNREDSPTESSPLTYREYVYAVAQGTPEEEAKRLIFERFEHVRATLDATRSGKLVNLAVFDHIFQGRPQRRPLVTLTWKDWKGDEPELHFPQREGQGETPTPLAPRAGPKSPSPAVAPAAQAQPPPEVQPAAKPAPVATPTVEAAPKAAVKPTAQPKGEPAPEAPVVAEPEPEPKPAPAKADPAPAPIAPVAAAEPQASCPAGKRCGRAHQARRRSSRSTHGGSRSGA